MYTLEINHYNLDIKIETEEYKLLHMLQAIVEATYDHYEHGEEEDEEEEIIVTKKKK